MNNFFKLSGKMIGDGHPCFITFELGPTHDGVASAKRLIQYAANAGADAVIGVEIKQRSGIRWHGAIPP